MLAGRQGRASEVSPDPDGVVEPVLRDLSPQTVTDEAEVLFQALELPGLAPVARVLDECRDE